MKLDYVKTVLHACRISSNGKSKSASTRQTVGRTPSLRTMLKDSDRATLAQCLDRGIA